MTNKKTTTTAAKKNNKKEEVVDFKVEELMPPRVKMGFLCRALILGSFAGIALLVYDRVEPGKIPFFAEADKEVCENPVHDVADQINEMLSGFSSQIQNSLSSSSSNSQAPAFNLQEVVGSINNSKNEILDSFSGYLKGIKDINLQTEGRQQNIDKAIDEAKEVAAKDSKQEVVLDIVFNRVSSIINRASNLESQKKSFTASLKEAKERILSVSEATEVEAPTEEGEISSKIKNALGQFVTVKKVDDKKVMIEQLFSEVDELIESNDYTSLSSVLGEIKSITEDSSLAGLVESSKILEKSEVENTKENLQEVLTLIEKLRSNN